MDFSLLEQRLGIVFRDRNLLIQALTHRSYLSGNREWHLGHNERLEFLGDAVLDMVVTEYLYRKYPQKREGELTQYRMAFVAGTTCLTFALQFGLNEYLLLSNGEKKDTGHARRVILADAFEALIGALYVDQGYAAAQLFIANHLLAKADEIIAQGKERDSKSKLMHKMQLHLRRTPRYELLKESGLNHEKVFVVGVYAGSKLIAQGEGRTKKLAGEAAATAALALDVWNLPPTR